MIKDQIMKKQIKVGVQRNITDPNSQVESVPLLSVLEQMMTSENLKRLTEEVLNAPSKDERSRLKLKLPAVIISADTTCRRVSPDDKRTGLILMDLDGADNPDISLDEMSAMVQKMCEQHAYIIGYCLSPSWKGLKVLCGIDPDISTHQRSFMALEKQFLKEGIIVDRACKDVKRVNFLCYDPSIKTTMIDRLKAWTGETVEPAPLKERKQYTAPSITGSSLSADDEAQLCLQHLHPDMDYADWVAVGMALHSHGCSCDVWAGWSAGGESYRPGECERKWAGFSGGGVTFATVVKMATDANGGTNPLFIKRDKLNATFEDFDVIKDPYSEPADDSDDKPALPAVTDADSLVAAFPDKPEQLIEGVIGLGDKLILSASSKAGKTWLMLHLAYAVQNGDQWLGHQCKQADVLYVNFELTEPWLAERFRMITRDKHFQQPPSILNLRGYNVGWVELSAHIKAHIDASSKHYGLIILDPIYKMLGDCDENSNGDVAMLLNALERMGHETKTATAFSHHHSKGNKSGVDAIERMSGAGVWGREPDAIIDLVSHEDDNCYVVDTTARNFAKPAKVVVRCEFPNFIPVEDSDPEALKKPGGSAKKLTEANVIDMCKTVPLGIERSNLVNKLHESYNVSKQTARSRINEMTKNDKLEEKDKLITVPCDDQPF